MKKAHNTCLFLLSLILVSYIPLATLQAQDYEPQVGQHGKDVIWVPTPDEQSEAMLNLAEASSADYVIDLGSGDGRIVIAAAMRGATALGIEFNPDLVELSKRNAKNAGVSGKASFIQADIFETDFSKASVITMYLLPDLNLKLRPKILELAPGTRIVSHAFSMGEWKQDSSVTSGGRNLYLWIVPAKVHGEWTWIENSEPRILNLTQNFQTIEGTMTAGENTRPILNADLRGDQIAFTWGKQNYSGQITQDRIRGTIQFPNSELEWVTTRKLELEE